MRICFLEGDMSRGGGTERMTAYLSNSFLEYNEVSILSLNNNNGKVFFELNSKINHIFLRRKNMICQILQIRNHLKLNKIDVIINVDTGMGIFGILSSVLMKNKVITWEHSNYYNNWDSKIFPYLRNFAAKYSDYLVVLTEKDKINYLNNIRSLKSIEVIPNPIVKQNFFYKKNSKIILSAGSLYDIKGYDLAIEVAMQIFKKHPDWKWIICGEGPERKKLEELIKKSKLEDNVILKGIVKNMEEEYKRSSIFVLTSKIEGLPMVLLEAKSWGLPMVSFDIMTGPSDIIDNGINGYLVEPYNINTMISKINELIENENIRFLFSKNSYIGLERFEEQYILDKWNKILNKEWEECSH